MTDTDRDAVERLASVCERPHGNPTFGEKAEIADALRALLAAKETAEAEAAALRGAVTAECRAKIASGRSIRQRATSPKRQEYGRGLCEAAKDILALIKEGQDQ